MKNEDHPLRQEGEFTSLKKEPWFTRTWKKFNDRSEAITEWGNKNETMGILVSLFTGILMAAFLIMSISGIIDLWARFMPAGEETESSLQECQQELEETQEQNEYLENMFIQQRITRD